MTRNRKTVDLYCVKKRKLQNKVALGTINRIKDPSNQPRSQGLVGNFQDGGSTRHLGNYPQDPGNEVAIKPEHRLSTWVGKRERFPTNFAIMSQSESYFASLGVVKWLPCELLRERWRQTTKRGVTTTRHERELIFLSFFIFYFK